MADPSSSKVSPSDDHLQAAVIECQGLNPGVGSSKIHAAVLESNPTWLVSEKRVRKFLRVQRGEPEPAPGASSKPVITPKEPKPSTSKGSDWMYENISDETGHPVSKLNESLDISLWTDLIEVKTFEGNKGKGLVASKEIKSGEVIWKEDPFVYCSKWIIQDAQQLGTRCANCALPLPSPKYTPIPCPHECGQSWCNRLCATRAKPGHAFICMGANPGSVPLMRHIREQAWLALGAWTRVVAQLLAEWAASPKGDIVQQSKDWQFIRSLATMSLRERVKIFPNWQAGDEELWKRSFSMFLHTFALNGDVMMNRKLSILKKNKAIPLEVCEELLSYDSFLRGLGKMSLNLESHGGLYRLHSHLNHSCEPNVSVRHFDVPAMPGKITMIAMRDIAAGEELFITYVDPAGSVKARRKELKEWGFGECDCGRCEREAAEVDADGQAGQHDIGTLEDELRGFLKV